MKFGTHIVILLISISTYVQAQPSIEDFIIGGQTQRISEHCFELTPDEVWSSGGIWYRHPIDLSQTFRIELKLMLGCEDRLGADGMVFVFSPFQSATGYQGEGMGFAGVQPSLGVEVDTWENDHLGDPIEDHVAILRDGYVSHYYNLAGPVRIPNVEDCELHEFVMAWDVDEQRLSLELDGVEVIAHTMDIITEIFGGESEVYMGVTAATGRYMNRQQICFDRIEITPPLADAIFGRVMQSKLRRGIVSKIPISYDQDKLDRDSRLELYKLVNLMRRYPTRLLEVDVHVDQSGDAEVDSALSRKRAQTIAEFLSRQGIDPQRMRIRGLGSKFSSEQSTASRDRVEIRLFQPKT